MECSNDWGMLCSPSVLPSCGESSKWYKWCKFRHGAMEWPRWLVSLSPTHQRGWSRPRPIRGRGHEAPANQRRGLWSPPETSEPGHYIIQTQWYPEYILYLHYHHNDVSWRNENLKIRQFFTDSIVYHWTNVRKNIKNDVVCRVDNVFVRMCVSLHNVVTFTPLLILIL